MIKLTPEKIKRIENILKRLGYEKNLNLDDKLISKLEKFETIKLLNKINVVMICTKDKSLKLILQKYFTEDDLNLQEQIDLNYSIKDETIKSKHSSYYMKNICDLLNLIKENSIYIETKNDYPIRISNDYCKIILAPRGI